MKNIKILFLVVFAYFTSYAQDPQLFENDWYLQKVIIDEVEHLPPFPNVIGRISFDSVFLDVSNSFCEEGFETPIDYISNSNFNIDDGGNVLLGTCTNPDIIQYGIYHFSIYHNLNNSIAKNPFSYSFLDNNGILELTIVNTDGDIAIYGNELLSNQDFENTSFELYPNPVKDELFISIISDLVNFNVIIFDINGKQVLSLKNVDLNNKPIDVLQLTSGIYFILLEDKLGRIAIKKFTKN